MTLTDAKVGKRYNFPLSVWYLIGENIILEGGGGNTIFWENIYPWINVIGEEENINSTWCKETVLRMGSIKPLSFDNTKILKYNRYKKRRFFLIMQI